MAKTKVKSATKAGKLAGKMIAFVGRFLLGARDVKVLKAIAVEEGGTVVDAEKSAPDILVAGDGVGGKPPAAIAKVQKKNPAVQVMDESSYFCLVSPTDDEIVESMLSLPNGHRSWVSLQERMKKCPVIHTLSGKDFRNQTIEGDLSSLGLKNCDLRGAKISANFGDVKGSKFDGAILTKGEFRQAEDCSLKNVTMNETEWERAEFVRCDFTGAKLSIKTGSYTTANECVFKTADLSGCKLEQSRFWSSDFSGADLSKAGLEECNFTGANLSGATLSHADLTNAILVGADLRKTKLHEANLSGADFTGAIIDGADFLGAKLTDVNFAGIDLSKAKNLKQAAVRTKNAVPPSGNTTPPSPPKSGAINFEQFIQQLYGKVEKARLEKAGLMLKAERFQLFAEVNDDALVGVVKSQTNKDLVYSCRLASDGEYCCCTQNLRPCGGLRGALCKHLLVLIIGLAKAGRLDVAKVDHWVNLSCTKRFVIFFLYKDVMSETFLRYKGAEAGEVDWRPTETIPEDFYAM
jgi:uncharacterized protein YjbI with pentapeptide repeats